ncbi:MAG: hypothetical protein ACRDG3_09875 [Tepidiformaceae bacterium]
MTVSRGVPARKRNNAPIRPRKPATGVPDLLFAVAAIGWSMAIVFVLSSYLDADVTIGEAGKLLARVFAGMLGVTGLFFFLLGLVLLRDERDRLDHYLVPMVLGAFIGALEAILFLWPADKLLILPFLLLIFVLRPIRRRVSRWTGYQG